MRLTP